MVVVVMGVQKTVLTSEKQIHSADDADDAAASKQKSVLIGIPHCAHLH